MIQLKHIQPLLPVALLVLGFCTPGAAADGILSALTRDLSSQTSAVRIQAARALGELGDPGATGALIQALQDPDKDVCRAAAQALGQIRDSRAVEAMSAALADEHDGVRAEAAAALGEIRDPFQGIIDEVKIFRAALSAKEIQEQAEIEE
jgi:HEAT repeat protein